MEDTLIGLYALVDDFCKEFLPAYEAGLIKDKIKTRNRKCNLSVSEIMTIYIHFQQSRYRDFKSYYINHVCVHLKYLFPKLVSYSRFVTLIKNIIVPLFVFLHSFTKQKTGIYFVDSMILKACHVKREKQHKVFEGLAAKAKSSMGWFYGFKIHLLINDIGEIMAFQITAGNVDDRKPVPNLIKNLIGKLFGDRGYISQKLFSKLFEQGIQLVTRIKKGMKNKLMPLIDRILLRKRAVIETVNDQLKNICQIEHTRHRSAFNFIANILAALCAYMLQPKKPSIRDKVQTVIALN